MTDSIVIPFGTRLLVLDPDQLDRALRRGDAYLPATSSSPTSTSTVPVQDEPLLDAKEAAALLRLPESTLYRQAKAGKLPAVRVGRFYRFRRSTLLAAVASDSQTVGRR